MPNSPSTDEIDIESEGLSKDDIIDLLGKDDESLDDNKDDDKGEKDTKDKDDKDDDETKSEEKEDELELKEEEEDKDLIKDIKGPPRKKEIEAFAPGFFKKFPEVEREYFKAQQFTEVIGTVEDAKELVGKAEILDAFETDLSEGNTEKILKQVKENSPEAFDKIADTYLEAIAKVDRDAYFNIVERVVKQGIIAALNHSKNTEDEDLKTAAINYYKYMFPQDTEIKFPEKRTAIKEDDSLKRERAEFIKERFETAQNDLQGKIDNTIKSTIDSYIDPKNQMTSYVKKNAIKDAMSDLESTIANDSQFKKSVLDPLWKKAHEDKFSRTSLDRIKSAYLSKAKTLLKPIIQKSRTEALKGLGNIREEKDRRGPIPPGRTSTSSSSSGRNKEVKVEKGMRTLDVLNSLD